MITMISWLKRLDNRGLIFVAILLLGVAAPIWLNLFLTSPAPKETKQEPPAGLSNFELGQYYFNHGIHADGTYDLAKARHYYEESLFDGQRINKLTWHQLGRIDFLEGRFDDAIYKFNTQEKTYGDLIPNVYYMLGLTYGYKARKNNSQEDWLAAEANFQRYLDIEPTSPWGRVDLSWVYFSQGKFEEMKAVLEEGLKTSPDNPWLLNMYGLALLNTGDKAKAHENFLLAEANAKKLTEAEWGSSYPGNDPGMWGAGLEEFRNLIKHNVSLSQT